VCARAATRGTAAFAGFGAWVGLVVLLPAVLTAAVSLAVPQPSREAYIVAMRDAVDQVQADRVGVMARFYDQHPEWKPERTALDKLPAAVTRLARAMELERTLAAVDARHEQARERRAALLQTLSLASPVSLTHESLSMLAGNGTARHQQFLAEVQVHQRALRDFFQARIQQAALGDEQQPCPVLGPTPNPGTCRGSYGFDDFPAVPRFTASPVLAAAPALPSAAGVLLAWVLALLALAAWATAARAQAAMPTAHSTRLQGENT
jgi:ABC-2 type transport system permease protein